jgi:hypothetical protein
LTLNRKKYITGFKAPGMTLNIPIGAIAVAKITTPACFAGEVGVCYGASNVEGQAAYGFIFETGRFKVFTADEVTAALILNGRASEAIANYKYSNDAQLKADFRAGRFATAFPSLKL